MGSDEGKSQCCQGNPRAKPASTGIFHTRELLNVGWTFLLDHHLTPPPKYLEGKCLQRPLEPFHL